MFVVCSTFIPTSLFIIFFILSWKNEYYRNYKMADIYNDAANLSSVALAIFAPFNILLSLADMILGHLLLGFNMMIINMFLFILNLVYLKKVIRNSKLFKFFL